MRILKEIIFGRVKAYNLVQMFEFISTAMDLFYSNHLLDIAHSRYRPGITYTHLQSQKDNNILCHLQKVRDSIYIVQQTDKEGLSW